MTSRVLLAIADPAVSAQARALVEESEACAVHGSASTPAEAAGALGSGDVDVVALHDGFAALPVMDFARQLSTRFPHVGLVLLTTDDDPALLRRALRCGVRDVVALPLCFEDLDAALREAAAWARSVRQRRSALEERAGGGTMLAVAGAKGGVGTTTVALHVALRAATSGPGQACLVDLDAQAGDVGGLLHVSHRRSVSDLADVAGQLGRQQLDDTLFVHTSGLRVLLAPPHGERGEELNGDVTREILGGIRSHHDVVVVDVGAHVTGATAAATRMADRAVVVATPDVPALRGVNRLVALWQRLRVRDDATGVLVNRASPASEVQADLIRRVVTVPLLRTSVPAAFRALEPAANSGAPERLGDVRVRHALAAVAAELGVAREPAVPARGVLRRRRAQDGGLSAELVALTPLLVVVLVLLWQLVLAGLTFVYAGHAAREAAREHAVGGQVSTVAGASVPAAWRETVHVDVGDEHVEVSLTVPALAPAIASPWRLSARAGTVTER